MADMTYEQGKKMVRASGTFDGVDAVNVINVFSEALWSDHDYDRDDVRTIAAAAFELGARGLSRPAFLILNRD